MRNLPKYKYQSGQALLVVVLIMAVALVVVLSIASRSTTDISKTTYDENALRAFSAAEAGIEDALLKNSGAGATSTVNIDTNANVSYTSVVAPATTTDTFNHPGPIVSGQSRTFWFVSHGGDGSLTCSGGLPCTRANQMEVCWGASGTADNTPQTPAIELTMYYDDSVGKLSTASPNNYQSVKTYRFAYDPQAGRRGSNSFSSTSGSCSFNPGSYAFSTGTINLNSYLPASCPTTAGGGCLVMLKVRALYNTATAQSVGLYVHNTSGAAVLPAQGTQVDSTGTAGDSTRKVSVFRSYAEPQSVFDAGVFSLNDLTK